MTSSFRRENLPPTANTNELGRIGVVWSAIESVKVDDDAVEDSILMAICIFHRIFAGFVQKSLDLRKKNIKLSPDFWKTHKIWAKMHQIVAKIFKKFSGICKNPVDLHQKSPKSTWISSNLAESHQIWSRSCLDLLKCCRISPNLAWISPNIAGFVYNVSRVGWLGY